MIYEFQHYIASVQMTPTITVTASSREEAEKAAWERLIAGGLNENGLRASSLVLFNTEQE